MRALFFALASTVVATSAFAQEIDVRPYVQDRGPTSAWILWETTSGEESRVEWGPTETLGSTSMGTAITTEGAYRVHEVELSPLLPATRYYYRVHTGAASSLVYHFTTPALASSETSFRMIAVSDMQHDLANPAVWGEVIHEGILGVLGTEPPMADGALAFVLLPGDLVDEGPEHAQWIEEFFAPAADLMSYVPFYPVIGNHERDTHFYDDYFHLPEGGPNPDRFFVMDHGNVRVVGLDSNVGLFGGAQGALLEEALTTACTASEIDFVFVELHHPYVSELWPSGESIFTGQVVRRVDQFTRDCGRPAVLFYGHTHAYSRGASRDAAHLWVNVATAGGNIDYAGEYDDQYDAPEVQVSQDEWGFVMLDVQAGDDPQFHLRRYSLGNERMARANELRDELIIRRYDEVPATPMAATPRGRVAPTCTTLTSSAFSDPDGDAHGASHWQVSTRCDAWRDPLVDVYRADENWYGGVDLAEGDDLTDEALGALAPNTYYCWRVRHRDRGLAWSAWSEPTAFQIEAGAVGCDDPSPLTAPPLDAGVADAGASAPASSCGCRATRAEAPLFPFALAGLLFLIRRRRSP